MERHTHDHVAGEGADQWAQQHATHGAAREPELRKATQALLEVAQVGPGMRVLDVACGAGDTTAAATALGADALGLDASAAMIRIASERFPGTRFAVGDMRAPPAGPWDVIVCRLGAHHAEPSWLVAALRVLAPGGRLAIAERDANEEDRTKGMRSLSEWKGLLTAAGYDEIEVVRSEAEFGGPIYIIAGRRPRGSGP